MPPNNDRKKDDHDALIERDILSGRKFTLAEGIGRAGGGLIKGESAIPALVRAAAEINDFIDTNLHDPSGALKFVLKSLVNGNQALLSAHLGAPLRALGEVIGMIVGNEAYLEDFVHQVDFKWGQMNNEPPHFEKQGAPPHPDDEYTIAQIEEELRKLMKLIPK